jgi:hypothetical protein
LVEIVEMIDRIGIVIPKEMQPAFLKTLQENSDSRAWLNISPEW